MSEPRAKVIEELQQAIARLLATAPPGHNLRLIGGFRYRLLNQSARLSRDIDYHWEGDIEEKQTELVALFMRRLLPDIKRRLGYEGDARAATGPEAQSPAVRVVELAFWQPAIAFSRIEIPVEITRIVCVDQLAVRTVSGVVYPTASDADLIESKIIALLNRPVIEHRDVCDIFLFSSHLAPDAAQRLQVKLAQLSIAPEVVSKRLHQLSEHRDYHLRALEALIADQLDPPAAANLAAAGGAKLVLDTVLDVLKTKLNLAVEAP